MTGRRKVISLDGGGVVADEPLVFGEGTRLRVHLTESPDGDATMYVENGRLHIVGQYARVVVWQIAPNRAEIATVRFRDGV